MKPETDRAIEFIDAALEDLSLYEGNGRLSEEVFKDGNCQIFSSRIRAKQIPAGMFWRWNQTRAKKTAPLPRHEAKISFVKLIPRKLRADITDRVPNYKLWQFEIVFQTQEPPKYILWCEKGQKYLETETNVKQGPSSPLPPNRLFAAKLSYICN